MIRCGEPESPAEPDSTRAAEKLSKLGDPGFQTGLLWKQSLGFFLAPASWCATKGEIRNLGDRFPIDSVLGS